MQITWLQDTNCGQENDQSHRHSRSLSPVTRYQSPKWHINIIARECGLRPSGVSQSLRIFALPASLCDCQTHKGRRILIFPLSFLLLVFLFFYFRCSVHALNFHSGLSILKGVWKCKKQKKRKKWEKCATLWHLLAPLPAEQEQKKYNYKEAERRMKGTKCDVNM